jgi:hypothetical protein
MPAENNNELLIRLDERLKSMQSQFDVFAIKLSLEIESLKKELKEERSHAEDKYVTREEFEPLKKVIWGAVGLIISGVMTAAGSILFHVK